MILSDLRPQNYWWQNRKEYKGKTNLAQSVLACLLWLLYRLGSTHRPHMYPMPGRVWGMGVVRGCARAVPAQPHSLTAILHNLAVVPARRHPLCVRLPSAKTFFIAAILLWENNDVGIILFYSVIYNSIQFNSNKLYWVIITVSTLLQITIMCPL